MFYYFCLFAQTNLGRSFQKHSRTSKSLFANKYLIIIVLGIAAVWVGIYYWDKFRKAQSAGAESTDELFGELCQAHKLEKTERRLLIKASEQQNLDDPALLFVNPELFSKWKPSTTAEARSFASLGKRLFGQHWIA